MHLSVFVMYVGVGNLWHAFIRKLFKNHCPRHKTGARCSSVVRAFAHGMMGHRIDPSWGEPIELFFVPASAPQLANKGCGMCYPVCVMMHIKVTHLAAAGFLSRFLSDPLPYV